MPKSQVVVWTPDLSNPEARILAEELMEYEIKVSEDANDRYGAFQVGTQDDLVTALGLALQEDGPRRAIILGG